MRSQTQITCPSCGARSDWPEEVRIHCGRAGADCVCARCGHRFDAPEIDYWLWLGLESAPPTD